MDPRLQQAIEKDDVDELHRLIVEDRNLLDFSSEDPFPNSLLHLAAAAGKTQVAMEIAILKPSFTQKLNPDGCSPMHLALQHKHYHTARALMTFDPKLIRIRGRRGITPLHHVAGKEGDSELELLAEFLLICSSSIKDLTSRCETAVHVAVKNHNLKAFKVLFGWLKRVDLTEILDWKDQDGNTVLHIAASEEQQPEIIKMLIRHTNVNAKNFQDKTALEIFQANPSSDQDIVKRLHHRARQARRFTHGLSLSEFFSMELTIFEKCACVFGIRDKSLRNRVLLLSILIATITFQATLPPSGEYEEDFSSNPLANSSSVAIGEPHQVEDLIRDDWPIHLYVAFLASIGIIWATAVTLWRNLEMVYCSLAILMIACYVSLEIGSPGLTEAAEHLLYAIYMSLLIAAVCLPLLGWTQHVRILKQIDATRRPIGYFIQLKD